MSSGTERERERRPAEGIGTFVGRRLRRFTLVAAGTNLLLCLLFVFGMARANSTQICSIVDVNIQSYLESLSREIVIGNLEHIETILDTLKASGVLDDVRLNEPPKEASALPADTQCRFNGMQLEFSTSVVFGQREVAQLEGNISWIPVPQILGFIGATALFSLFLLWVATRFLSQDLHKALVAPIGKLARGEVVGGHELVSDVLKIRQDLEASKENAQYAAVANMTQMFAHDVRKPFSMIQIVLHNIAAARSLSEVQDIAEIGAQEIQRALTSVTGMLSDVMEIGHDTALSPELASPRSLVDAVVRETGRLFPDSELTFSTSFEHRLFLEIDTLKVQRVFSNIVGNAVQAMNGRGHLWFRAGAPDIAGFVELTIGNSGSHIEPADMERLFDIFFTKGKKDGTGLGLAIARKVVCAHGGQIGCRSSREEGVEFWFTLPVGSHLDDVEVVVPANSQEVRHALRNGLPSHADAFGGQAQADDYETELLRQLGERRLKVLVLDDEALYRNALIGLLRELKRAGPRIDLLVATTGDEALAYATAQPDVGLFDYDLGGASRNGIEILKLMRQRVPGLSICIHSNRIGGAHYKEAVDAGAEHFLPKPMSQVHLLRVLSESVANANLLAGLQVADLPGASTAGVPSSTYEYYEKPVAAAWPAQSVPPASGIVAVLDDCTFHRNVWIQRNLGRPLITFESPEVFWRHVQTNPAFFDGLALIVTDQNFGQTSAMSGLDFARTVKGKPVFLASYGEFPLDLGTGIAGVLPGKTMDWDELHAFCRGVREAAS